MSIAAILTPCAALEASTSTTTVHLSFMSLNLNSSSCRRHRNLTSLSVSSSSSSASRFGAPRRLPLRRRHKSARIRAVSENLGSLPDPLASSSHNRYHPSEEIEEPVSDGAQLTDAETARTLVEVNSKATLIFSGLTDDDIQENIIWPDLPYLTDDQGDIYFEVGNHEDILQTLIGDDKVVQVIIGLDDIDLLEEMDISGPSGFNFEMEDIETESEDSEIDDDSDEDAFTVLEDEEDDLVASEASNNWTNLETMQFCHPMNFARKLAEVVSNANMDWMDQPSASIVIQGVLRPAFVEEHNFTKKHLPGSGTSDTKVHHIGRDVGENIREQMDKDQGLHQRTAFYKFEMIKIQLVSAYGTQSSVEVQDFRKAGPDAVVHHAARIISQLEAVGDKATQALKSLCLRVKNIQVEEATIIGVDSLGFDLKICSGTQVQTLRFTFNTRATSESTAERQLHDLLFPRLHDANEI